MSDKQKPARRQPFDPTVADILSQDRRRSSEPEQRITKPVKPNQAVSTKKPVKLATRSQQVGIDQGGRSKATYDLPVARQNLIREMAQTEDVSQGDIVEAAIVAFYEAWQAGKVDLTDMKQITRSLKATWKLAIPDDFSIFST